MIHNADKRERGEKKKKRRQNRINKNPMFCRLHMHMLAHQLVARLVVRPSLTVTLPRASRSLISPVVTETVRQKKAKELPASSSPSPLLLCVPLASSQCWTGPGQSSCRLPCAQLAVIRLFLLGRMWGGRGCGRDGGAGWGVEKGMRCTVGASRKAVRTQSERALLSSSAMRE